MLELPHADTVHGPEYAAVEVATRAKMVRMLKNCILNVVWARDVVWRGSIGISLRVFVYGEFV